MNAILAEPPNNNSLLRLDHDSEPRIISTAPGSGQALLGGTPSAVVFDPGAFFLLGVPTMEDDPRSLILAWAKHARDVVAIHRGYVRLTGDIGAGAALSQILYWFDDDRTGAPRARIERDGSLWIAKTYDEFALELGLVDGEGNPRGKVARRYVQNLLADGLIEIGVFRFNGTPTIHIRPLWDVIFERAVMPLARKSQTGISEAGKSQTGTLENPTVGKSSKEALTTAKTTLGAASNDDAGGAASQLAAPALSGDRLPASASGDPTPLAESNPGKDAVAVQKQPRGAADISDHIEGDAGTHVPDAPREDRAVFGELAAWMGFDLARLPGNVRGRLNKTGAALRAAGFTADDVATARLRWPESHWKGQKGQAPAWADIEEFMAQAAVMPSTRGLNADAIF